MGYVIGVDGGGTKTAYSICKLNESHPALIQPAFTLIGEGTNPQAIGFKEMASRIANTLLEFLQKESILPSEVKSICCGLAGVGRQDDETMALQALTEPLYRAGFHPDMPLMICSDLYIAIKGALKPEEKEGILIISGTGSNAIGLTGREEVVTSGGWGHILGDEGSGYQIGLQALNRLTRTYDKRADKTILSSMILTNLNMTRETELISYIYSKKSGKHDIAKLAKLVIEAADRGDPAALTILQNAADELVLHVKSLFNMHDGFNEKTIVTTAGSIFTHSEIIRERFKNELGKENLGIYQEPYSSPLNGAVLIALEQLREKHSSKE
ncbi:N-acetylglucosamine kinase [Jeotgalibacillus proteolyticus]|uniref:ATPase n=1 Tax=Jeotgalibacillus proteolyticus TaxID=2082395 RepID=A0A2S5GA02_9BACL|nr:BadF/BadG/BcrA/BcrD ATPase family protein [Jeotgalibacillus proteolyticus]PPA69809.1 ATPase [Jeotgalibacillus proteolyticus]